MVLRVTYNAHHAAEFIHDPALGNGFFRVVRTFALDVRPKVTQDRFGCRVIKDHRVIHAGKRRNEFGARAFREQWPSRALQLRDGAIAVDSHDQDVTLLLRSLEKTDVAHVQNLEAAVGESNSSPGRAQPLAERPYIVTWDEF